MVDSDICLLEMGIIYSAYSVKNWQAIGSISFNSDNELEKIFLYLNLIFKGSEFL